MATKINFEDNGQDFMWWIVDDGKVVDCGPFQASVWCGSTVIDADLLQPGDFVDFLPKRGGMVKRLVHRVESIEEVA